MIQILRETGPLLRKEFLLEWRQKYALNGLLLYAATMVFVICLSLFQKQPDPKVWNVILWLIMLFVGVNAVAKSFMGESQGQMLYLYQMASPQAIVFSKLIYNSILLLGLTWVSYLLYRLFSGQGPDDPWQYVTILSLGALGFAANLTLVSAIAARGRNQATLIAVLGFHLLNGIMASAACLEGKGWALTWPSMAFSAVFFVLLTLVSFLLFPYLWRE
jgi:heme exporter protein B